MKILATGAAGMLGSSLVPALVQAGPDGVAPDIDLATPRPWGAGMPAIDWLDVRERDVVDAAVDDVAPDLVLHLAAETSLEASDADPDHAYLTNAIATKYVALACRRRGARLVYISTAGVFDGVKAGAYTEFDEPNPINTYGDAKYQGERIVRDLVEDHYILRAGWMVGGGPGKDHKFVARILDQLREGRDVVHAVGDKLGTPTYTRDFGRCLVNLLDAGVPGLYHMACEGEGSRYDVAACLLELLGRDDVELVEVGSDFFAEEFPSARPPSEIMRNMALDLQGMNLMRPWRDALADYLERNWAALGLHAGDRPAVAGVPA